MPINYADTIKQARLLVVAQAVAGGTLELCTAGYAAVLAALPIPASPIGTIFAGVLTLPVPWSANASGSGTAAVARLKKANGDIVAQGLTVGTTSAYNVVIASTQIAAGSPVSLTSAQITHAA